MVGNLNKLKDQYINPINCITKLHLVFHPKHPIIPKLLLCSLNCYYYVVVFVVVIVDGLQLLAHCSMIFVI